MGSPASATSSRRTRTRSRASGWLTGGVRRCADPETDALAVEVDGRLQGFVALRGDELLHFGTAVDTWGTGLAEDAHDLALDRLARHGVGTARLWAFRENERAVRLYERLGWQPTGETRPTTFPPNPTLVEYTLDLAPGSP